MIIIFIGLGFYTQLARAFGPYETEYVSNHDGDTITLKMEIWPDLYQIRQSRLYGVDTPELGGRAKCDTERVLAMEAKMYVQDVLRSAEYIDTVVIKRGNFGRPVVTLRVDGEDLASGLVNTGYGRIYTVSEGRLSWCPDGE